MHLLETRNLGWCIGSVSNRCQMDFNTVFTIGSHNQVYRETGKKVKMKVKSLSRVWLFVTLWTVAYQASPSMGFSRQEYWSRLPFPSPGDLPDPGIEPRSPTSEADALTSEPPGKPHCPLRKAILWVDFSAICLLSLQIQSSKLALFLFKLKMQNNHLKE